MNRRRDPTAARRIWKRHHGQIPLDGTGRTMEVHHIDGNHSNNDIENLTLVTIEEHFALHEAQEDWGACQAIAMRMKTSPEERSRLGSLAQKALVESGKHIFLGGKISRAVWENDETRKILTDAVNAKVAAGTHNAQSAEHRANNARVQREIQKIKFDSGNHPLQGEEVKQRSRVASIKRQSEDKKNGTGFFGADNPSKIRCSCVVCRQETSPAGLKLGHTHITSPKKKRPHNGTDNLAGINVRVSCIVCHHETNYPSLSRHIKSKHELVQTLLTHLTQRDTMIT